MAFSICIDSNRSALTMSTLDAGDALAPADGTHISKADGVHGALGFYEVRMPNDQSRYMSFEELAAHATSRAPLAEAVADPTDSKNAAMVVAGRNFVLDLLEEQIRKIGEKLSDAARRVG